MMTVNSVKTCDGCGRLADKVIYDEENTVWMCLGACGGESDDTKKMRGPKVAEAKTMDEKKQMDKMDFVTNLWKIVGSIFPSELHMTMISFIEDESVKVLKSTCKKMRRMTSEDETRMQWFDDQSAQAEVQYYANEGIYPFDDGGWRARRVWDDSD